MAERIPEQIVIVGSTGLMTQCRRIAEELAGGIPVTALDTAKTPKPDVMALLSAAERPTLVLSIANPYLFPAEVVRHPMLTIVNLHRGLLPGHRGRNVSTWAIFFDEKENGVSWHLVDEDVDTGKLIRTVRVPVLENDTALSLMRRQHEAAAESFAPILKELLQGRIPTEQPADRPSDLHLSREIPNGGLLDLAWSGRQMSCFLRAMDFGPLHVLGMPRVEWNGAERTIRKYAVAQDAGAADGAEYAENLLTVRRDGLRFSLTLTE